MLLNGTGGIGKTALAIEYLNKYQDSYAHIAFVQYNNDIKESFLTAFKDEYILKGSTPDERFSELLHILENLKGRNLLVVDDIKTQENFDTIKNLSSKFDLLITSRVEFGTVNKIDIEHLPNDKAKELFLKYYETDENIDNLLEYLNYHTLFIKLTAQTLKNSRVMTIKKLEEKFVSGEFGNITNNLEKNTFNMYLNKLFNLDTLNEMEVLILKRLSLLPSIEIDFGRLTDFLSINEGDIEEFDSALTSLSKLGWLIQNKNSFKLHQIIKEFLLSSHHISYEECEDIVENFIDKLFLNLSDNPIDKFEFISNAVSIAKNIDVENEKIATLFNNISTIYQAMGELDKALEFQFKALKLTEEVLGEKHPNLATSYNNISMIYKAMGELDKALEFQLKALKLREEVLGEKHPNLATSYNNISTIYQAMGELDKALEFQLKDLKLTKEVLGEKHPNLAISYANIAQIYLQNTNIVEAKKSIDKAEKIYRDLFLNGHPTLDTIVRIREHIYKN